ncbi:hypothetical protein PtB15_18B465 [Puccinia triticina]|nr:hypothetical protein PtB15_18B465 [Puccinia triticina]
MNAFKVTEAKEVLRRCRHKTHQAALSPLAHQSTFTKPFADHSSSFRCLVADVKPACRLTHLFSNPDKSNEDEVIFFSAIFPSSKQQSTSPTVQDHSLSGLRLAKILFRLLNRY